MKKVCYLISILLVSLAIAGCPSDNDGNKVQRDFHIEEHWVRPEYMKCWYLDEPMPHTSELVTEKEIVEPLQFLWPGRAYGLTVRYFNDQEETNQVNWIRYETFIDGERYNSGGLIVPHDNGAITTKIYTKGDHAHINLFHYVPYTLVGKTIVVDVWVQDKSGVNSEVYTFELTVQHLWIYPPTE